MIAFDSEPSGGHDPFDLWNQTAAPFLDEPVIARFDAIAQERPDAVALVVGGRHYRYGELAERVHRLAHWLRARGVASGTLVALCLRRDVSMIVSVLAIMASGAAYVPLDPRNPARRQAEILEDAAPALIFSERDLVSLFPAHAERLVFVDELDLAPYDTSALALTATPKDFAYVIFTSGSTGRPKGVMIDHHALAAFIAWTREAFDDDELSGVLCSSSIAFDVSVFELFAPLCHGGRVILVDNVLALRQAPARDEVRLISSVASGLAELTRNASLPAGVRTVMQAGERLHGALAHTLLAHRGLRLLNLCGATEDTVYSVWHHVTAVDGDPPIGRPFTNHTAYVLAPDGTPVPVGTPGELCYGGEGIARGYLNRPDLTAARFVPNPFGHSERMYRSGDLARWNERGELEFLHRLDDQVKIRGYRIELGEIERHLLEHERVAEAIVAPHGEGDRTRLAAYVVAKGVPPTGDELRAFLTARLPDYMVPARCVVLEEFPHNASGKVDRAALPDPFAEAPLAEVLEHRGATGSNLELRLCELVAEVLEIPEVGTDDNFFSLGGHSLLAARLTARLEELFPAATARFRGDGLGTLLASFYQNPTVRALAASLEGRGNRPTIVTPMRVGDPAETPVFWFHGMFNGNGLYTWQLLEETRPEVPFYVVHPHGYDNRPFPADIPRMAEERLAQIRAVRPHGPYVIGGFCNGALIAYEIAVRLRAAGETVEALVLAGLPPLHDLAEDLSPLTEGLCRTLRLDARTRGRVMRWSRAGSGVLQTLLRGARAERRSLAEKVRARFAAPLARHRAHAQPAPLAFSNPSFKNEHYERAIYEYTVPRYPGVAYLLVGEDDERPHYGPDGGWSRYIETLRLRVVPGGYHFVLENPRHVGALLHDALSAPAL
ncbi:MAG TPA: amino acid adenylation domain-containing protein [Candidatus Acidoferrum sp.]|nr:amino acid adenylation domain-containing protein [Candidatus Acidoferrum sp.]